MSGMWRRFWRWITLADIEAELTAPYRTDLCDFCHEKAICNVQVNAQSWRTCRRHMNQPVEHMIRGDS